MMPEALKIGVSVSTAFGALGLTVVILLFAYYRRLRNAEITLKGIPRDQRAKVVDPFLTRYNIDAVGLEADKKYELIKLELEKRASRVTLVTIVVAAVFVICFTTASILQRYSSSEAKHLVAGDIAPAFGTIGGAERVRNLSPKENTELLQQWFSSSRKSIKIVTINGSSWIKADFFGTFEQAITHIPVTLLLLDYTDQRSRSTWDEAMREYHESVWPDDQFRDNFLDYAKLLKPDDHLTIGLSAITRGPDSRFLTIKLCRSSLRRL
jgi:hypothetical protein